MAQPPTPTSTYNKPPFEDDNPTPFRTELNKLVTEIFRPDIDEEYPVNFDLLLSQFNVLYFIKMNYNLQPPDNTIDAIKHYWKDIQAFIYYLRNNYTEILSADHFNHIVNKFTSTYIPKNTSFQMSFKNFVKNHMQSSITPKDDSSVQKIITKAIDGIVSRLNYNRKAYLEEFYKNKPMAEIAQKQFKEKENYVKWRDDRLYLAAQALIQNISILQDKEQKKRMVDFVNNILAENQINDIEFTQTGGGQKLMAMLLQKVLNVATTNITTPINNATLGNTGNANQPLQVSNQPGLNQPLASNIVPIFQGYLNEVFTFLSGNRTIFNNTTPFSNLDGTLKDNINNYITSIPTVDSSVINEWQKVFPIGNKTLLEAFRGFIHSDVIDSNNKKKVNDIFDALITRSDMINQASTALLILMLKLLFTDGDITANKLKDMGVVLDSEESITLFKSVYALLQKLKKTEQLAALLSMLSVQLLNKGSIGDPSDEDYVVSLQHLNMMLLQFAIYANKKLEEGLPLVIKLNDINGKIYKVNTGITISNDDHDLKENIIKSLLDVVARYKLYYNSGQHGGSEDQIKQAKEVRTKLDTVKKTLRSITDGLESIKLKYTQLHKIYSKDINDLQFGTLEDIKKNIESAATSASIPTNPSKGNPPDTETPEYRKAVKSGLGLDASMKDLGNKVMSEIDTIVTDKKKEINDVLVTLREIYELQPDNPTYVKRLDEVKQFIEGVYSSTGNKPNQDDKGIISYFDMILANIKSEYETAQSKIQAITSGIREEKANQIALAQANNRGVVYRGGLMYLPSEQPNHNETIKYIDRAIATIKDELQSKIVAELDMEYLRKSNHVMSSALGAEPNMFSTIYQNYIDEKNRTSQQLALEGLLSAIDSNELSPSKVLRVTTMDKVVFVFLTLFTRIFALGILERFVIKDWITDISWALFVYVIFYTLIMSTFILIVNFDVYRLRIIFNYVNFHGNGGLVMLHFGAVWLIMLLFMFMIWNNVTVFNGIERTYLTDETKYDIVYRIEVLSMIMWIALLLITVLINK